MRDRRWLTVGFLGVGGCFGFESPEKESYFLRPNPPAQLPPMTPASTEAAARVDSIGRRIIASNPQLGLGQQGMGPMFRTIGAPQAEVFHRGTSDIFITEGLVRQCTTDGQLAAILCNELARAVVERELSAPKSTRQPNRTPPLDPHLAADSALGTSADQTRLAELAGYQTPRQARNQPVVAPDAAELTRVCLLRTGFHDADLQAAGPLIQSANIQTGFERQMVPQN
jgi:hypothetical protein